jgi:type II secretory pathway pseudopilin PulG
MRNKKIKKNIDLFKNKIKGFTLVETLVAVFILTFTMLALMTVVADSLFAARYARHEITAIYLAQEASDYIRNDRDTLFFLDEDESWDNFLGNYSDCFTPEGCYFEVLERLKEEGEGIKVCEDNSTETEIKCPFFYYDDTETENPFYTYTGNEDQKSNFQRKIFMELGSWVGQHEIILTVTVLWKDGSTKKETVLETTFTKWQ